ncbi:Fumarylacetoacetate (FAA) hydrolase family protein [Pseudomonas sp. 24 E 13]|uniref:AraD1 family protein n=1 Tax=unclassified Pseudomonas TaxID=196821 RepID=UPI000812B6DD|nr:MULTISPECIES: AraD1 family protein [unclassified Pseudomonas]MBY8931917.1 FAH family protein [Pseudomonas sp. Wu6]CRM18195.1 Fumarylacetoacetate (FAA) hydrolase family protein [Pseudomonas sp. 44 R 15]CRM85434.1 Fumarylacetoacetate (FAA) hydrolase family protein [Pseudomonas sp. 24 E 13]CRN00646.1 Fumarylacetoacetate (FAA) hydrolase family protein [Pseudomonas sp. 34 E 7]
MRLVQFESSNGERRVGVVEGSQLREVRSACSVRELALAAIEAGVGLEQQVNSLGLGDSHDYASLLADLKVLPPLDHPDPAHMLISGTGLTHLGSASARDKMHQAGDETALTDTMRIFKWGVEGGKPAAGQAGVQPEWFYKGDGSTVVRPGAAFPVPPFAEDAGEEPEIGGLYVIGPDSKPYRVGFAVGNEFSDHIMERKNYLYLAHSKLRSCSYGPEVRVGELPQHLAGTSRILRNGEEIWRNEFLSGEANMCHSLENLEYHHFKYRQFLKPGDVHIHFFGTATLSFADGIRTQAGDVFEISQAEFGAPLVNSVGSSDAVFEPGNVITL